MVGDDVRREAEPEFGNPGQHFAFAGNGVGQHDIEGGQPVGCDHQHVLLADGEQIANFPLVNQWQAGDQFGPVLHGHGFLVGCDGRSGNYILVPRLVNPPGSPVISPSTNQSLGIPRHRWGKIIGGALGLMRGGLTGAIIGMLLGHMIDRLIWGLGSASRTRRVFFDSLFASLGHVCKADGRVTEVEIASAENLMRRMQLSEAERREAIRHFTLGKEADFDLEETLREFARFTMVRHDLRQMFLEILIEGAAVDGRVSSAEEAVLFRVSRGLHIPAQILSAMLSAYQATHGAGGRYAGPQAAVQSLTQAYATLGLKESATDAEIKRAYRKLVAQYHPDRLVSRGLPEEMMEKAKTRVREINTAYDRLKQARGIK